MQRYEKIIAVRQSYTYPRISKEYPGNVKKVKTDGESVQWNIYTTNERSQVVKPSFYFYVHDNARMLYPVMDRDLREKHEPSQYGTEPVSLQKYNKEVVKNYRKFLPQAHTKKHVEFMRYKLPKG